MKRILTTLMVSVLLLGIVGCANNASSVPDISAEVSSSVVASSVAASSEAGKTVSSVSSQESESGETDTLPAPKDASELEKAYIEELGKLLPAISKIQETQLAAVSNTEEAQQAISDLREQFTALGALEAPPKYRKAQEKFAECSAALLQLIDYSNEVLSLDEEEATPEKAAEAIKEMETLSNTAAEALNEATKIVWGDSDTSSSSEDENASS